MELIEKIKAVFDSSPIPDGEIISVPYGTDEGVSDYFTGRPWYGHSIKALRWHEVAMCYFTPEAHKYYLPAFMQASIEDPEEADVIPDNIIFHFSQYTDEYWWERIKLFTPEQCEVIGEFINLVADEFALEEGQVKKAMKGLGQASNEANKANSHG
ncbi:MAG: DUF6714 family protein [Candidatus Thiodiazotropha sp.]